MIYYNNVVLLSSGTTKEKNEKNFGMHGIDGLHFFLDNYAHIYDTDI